MKSGAKEASTLPDSASLNVRSPIQRNYDREKKERMNKRREMTFL